LEINQGQIRYLVALYIIWNV